MPPKLCARRIAFTVLAMLLAACVEPPPSSPPPPNDPPDQAMIPDATADASPEQDLSDPRDAGDMNTPDTTMPDADTPDADTPDADDMSELPPCPESDCVTEGLLCVAGQQVTCELDGAGCWTETTTPCDADAYCEPAARACLSNPCSGKATGDRFCAPMGDRVLVCQPLAINGLIIPVEHAVCGSGEHCTGAGVCRPHECTEAERDDEALRCRPGSTNEVEVCKANTEGLRQWVSEKTCEGSLQCNLTVSGFCACDHKCEPNTALCNANSNMYQLCATDTFGCRVWETRVCPPINPNLSYDWDGRGCYPSPDGSRKELVCRTKTTGHCGFHTDPC